MKRAVRVRDYSQKRDDEWMSRLHFAESPAVRELFPNEIQNNLTIKQSKLRKMFSWLVHLCPLQQRCYRDSERVFNSQELGTTKLPAFTSYAQWELGMCMLGWWVVSRSQSRLLVALGMTLTSPRLWIDAELISFACWWMGGPQRESILEMVLKCRGKSSQRRRRRTTKHQIGIVVLELLVPSLACAREMFASHRSSND